MNSQKLFSAVLFSFLASSASAAVVNLNATADLSLASVSATEVQAGEYFGFGSALPLSHPFSVATGDTFIYNLDFFGNQQLTVENLSLAWPLVITANYTQDTFIDMTGTLDLLGADNSVVATASKSNVDGMIHIAQVFYGSDFGNPASVTFSGFRYTGVVTSQDISPRTYDSPSLWFQGTSVSVTAVPEPESYAMLLAGLGLVGAVCKRRKAKQA